MNITFSQPQNNKYNPLFGAIPLAKYCYLHDKKQDVTVYQLEKRDVDYLQYISENVDGFYKQHDITDDSTKQVVKEAIDAGIEILQSKYEKRQRLCLHCAIKNQVRF